MSEKFERRKKKGKFQINNNEITQCEKLASKQKKETSSGQVTEKQPKENSSTTATNLSDISQGKRFSDDFKDLKGNMAYILTTKYAIFKERPSIMDDMNNNSMLNRSAFRGFHNLLITLSVVTFFSYIILRYQRTGEFINYNLIHNFQRDFVLCIMTWPLFTGWSYTSYVLQKLIIKGFSIKLVLIFHYGSMLALFIYCHVIVFSQDWCTTHSGFTSILACSHFLKMHSYTVINIDYRNDYLESKKNKQSALSDYPNNITLKNFTVYMVMPVLVYEQDYPRNSVIRYSYILKKSLVTAIAMLLGYILISDYVMPYVEIGEQIGAFELLCRIILPMTVFVMLLFYIVWEGICNIFGEISRFGDRQFYQDWWNSTTFEEYNRKWNKCVYNFLFRHVYLECIYRYKFSKKKAQLATFFFSAIFHEWILCMVFKTFKPFITAFMLQQIPLFWLTKSMQNTRTGNLFVWFCLMLGVPLIGVSYIKSDPTVTEYFKG